MLTMIGRKTHYFQFGAVYTNKPRCFCASLAAVPTQPTAYSPSSDEENVQCSQQDRSRRSSHKPKKSSSQLHRSSRRAQDSSGSDAEEPAVLSENHHSNRPSAAKMVTTCGQVTSRSCPAEKAKVSKQKDQDEEPHVEETEQQPNCNELMSIVANPQARVTGGPMTGGPMTGNPRGTAPPRT